MSFNVIVCVGVVWCVPDWDMANPTSVLALCHSVLFQRRIFFFLISGFVDCFIHRCECW